MNGAGRNAVDFSQRAIAVKMRIDRDHPVEGIRQKPGNLTRGHRLTRLEAPILPHVTRRIGVNGTQRLPSAHRVPDHNQQVHTRRLVVGGARELRQARNPAVVDGVHVARPLR